MTLSRYLLCLLVLGVSLHQAPLFAGMDVRVVGLFTDRAVLLVEGQQHLLKVGQTSPEGVKLVAASSDSALLLVDGEQVTARLDGRVSTTKRQATVEEVQVWRNTTGMYTTVGSINGLPVSFLVDTGATQVAMNAAQARRLGIDYHVTGSPAEVTTASGVERAWLVMLDSVKVGELEVRNVPAVVLEGAQPKVTLLGMSYLGRMEINNDGRLMTLKKRY
ncbi:MAG: TIGR02281 family clan AA aspartic protease [Gammaproteobacteria bacterium]